MPSTKLHVDRRLSILLDILSGLSAREVDYAVLHGGSTNPPKVSSDIDIVLSADPKSAIDPILRDMEKNGRLIVLHRLHYDIPLCYYYIIVVDIYKPLFLHLDCLFDAVGVNRYHLTSQELLDGRVTESWGIRINNENRALYLLIKRALKGQASINVVSELQEAFADANDAVWDLIDQWLGGAGRKTLQDFLRGNRDDAMVVMQGLRSGLERRFRLRHPFRFALSFALSILRKFHRAWEPSGFFVVLCGPDGSGKSTAHRLMEQRLVRGFREAWNFHWRPGLLPKLSRSNGSCAAPSNFQVPPQTSKYGVSVSLVRFGYYWLDFVMGYWALVYPKTAQTTLVVGERYFLDVLVQPERYGFAVPRWLMRAAACFVPKPDLVVLLTDDPDVIHARKPELSPARIGELLAAYEEEMKHWGNFQIVTTEGGPEAVATRLTQMVIQERSLRTFRQIRRSY